jgi:structural maintenance of chromosome 4
VTTACGGSLNALVTDTIEQGQAVIEHLRRTGGRASIFVLTKLGNKDLGPRDTPEGVPRLFDLIKPKDARLGPAFFKAVGQTLVAKDLEQANRIAYGKQRWRVVTLSGELIDTSGAMSGGGTRVQRGGMSSKFASDRVEPQVIARYEKESEAAQQDLRSFLAEKAAAEQAVAEIRQRIPEVELAITKIELDVKNGRKRVAEAEKRLRELQYVSRPMSRPPLSPLIWPTHNHWRRSQNKPDADDEKRIRSLDKEIAAHTKEVQTLRQKSSGIEDAIKALQDQILEVGGVKLRAQKSKVDGIKQQIELSSEKVTKAEVEQAKSAKEAEKLAKAIQTNTAKLEDLDEQLEELDAQLAVCVEDMRLVRATVDEARDGMESLEEELSAVKEELDEKSGALNAFKAREVRLAMRSIAVLSLLSADLPHRRCGYYSSISSRRSTTMPRR